MEFQPIDFSYIRDSAGEIAGYLGDHVILSIVPIIVAFVLALPIGWLVFQTKVAANGLLAVIGLLYAIPSLALFVAMPVVLGTKVLSPVNVIAALTIYTLALLVRSVVDGLRSVPALVKQSAEAVGLGSFKRLMSVELPLAMPVIFAGLRVATVSNIALVSVSVLVGQPSLGTLFDEGYNRGFQTPVWVGIVLAVALALLADGGLLLLQRGVLPWRRAARR